MNLERHRTRRVLMLAVAAGVLAISVALPQAQQTSADTRDPRQLQDEAFAKLYKEWTGDARYGSPLVDHLPLVKGVPTPKDVLGYHVGAPRKLTYYADILKYYRALAAATPRVQIESIGKSDEGRELVVVWVSSEQNMKGLRANRDRLAKIADPRGRSDARDPAADRDHQAELPRHRRPAQRRDRAVRDADGAGLPARHRNLADHHADPQQRLRVGDAGGRSRRARPLRRLVLQGARDGRRGGRTRRRRRSGGAAGRRRRRGASPPGSGQRRPTAPAAGSAAAPGAGQGGGQRRRSRAARWVCPTPSKYVGHDNNRDINLSLVQVRALTEWFYTAHPPIMHDLHESLPLMYTYSGGPPQNPNLDPLLFAELPWFSNWELAQMTKWGMPGVYTHAFMDGWSPGYYASVAYNHNGLMKMYETQSGRDPAADAARRRRRAAAAATAPRGAARARRGGRDEAPRGGAPARGARRGAPAEGQRAGGAAPRARAGGGRRRVGDPDRTRRRSGPRVVSRHPGAARTRPRRSAAAPTPTTCRPACSRRCSSPRSSRPPSSRTST